MPVEGKTSDEKHLDTFCLRCRGKFPSIYYHLEKNLIRGLKVEETK